MEIKDEIEATIVLKPSETVTLGPISISYNSFTDTENPEMKVVIKISETLNPSKRKQNDKAEAL